MKLSTIIAISLVSTVLSLAATVVNAQIKPTPGYYETPYEAYYTPPITIYQPQPYYFPAPVYVPTQQAPDYSLRAIYQHQLNPSLPNPYFTPIETEPEVRQPSNSGSRGCAICSPDYGW